MEIKNLAPITLFVYNRLVHTQKTLKALQKNELSDQSDLIIFSDGPKNYEDLLLVQDVRNYLKTVTGFKSIRIIKRDKNLGLAANIVNGVTDVLAQYDKIIVMEDDIVSSPAYLSFMNQALDFYLDEKKVWHITGWNEPVKIQDNADVFLWRVMNCWGWATWSNRWQYFEKNTQKLIDHYSKDMIHHFNLDGFIPYWTQVKLNKEQKINSWAVYWYATIHLHDGLCLNPWQSYIENIGFDGSGTHCGKQDYKIARELCNNFKVIFPSSIEESKKAVKAIKVYFKSRRKNLIQRILNKILQFLSKNS